MKYTVWSPLLTLALPVLAENISPIEVIEVNAQKRPQPITEVTTSVSVISGTKIANLNIKDATELTFSAPNFKVTQNAAEGTPPAINIRGVGSIDYNTSTQSPVGVYIDGATGGSANSQLVNLFDIESIEILRGPQGTLFGRNTTGGAVVITTVKPRLENSGYIDIGIAERAHRSAEGALNRKLNETSAVRFAFTHHIYNYSTNNIQPNTPQAHMRQTQGRASIYSEINKLTLNGNIYFGEWQGVVNPPANLGVIESFDASTGLPDAFCSPQQAGSLQCTDAFGFNDGSEAFHDLAVNNNVNNNSPHSSSNYGLNIEAKYQISDSFYWVSQTHGAKLDRKHAFNSDASPSRLGEGNQDVIVKNFSQELRLHKNFDRSNLIVGAYWLKEDLIQDNDFDLFRDFRDLPSLFSIAAQFFYDNQINITSQSIFSNIDTQLSDNTSIELGLRYNWEEVSYSALGNINVPLFSGDTNGLTIPGWNAGGKVKDNNLSGKIAIHHEINKANIGFFSFSRGFKSGGYNGALITSQFEADNNFYEAEALNAYEIGLHSQLGSNTKLYTAIFYYDYQDQQVFMNQSAITPGAPPLQLITNVGESSIHGLELELDSKLSKSLFLNVAFGYLPKANLKSFINASGDEITNNRLPFTSEFTLNIDLNYAFEIQQHNFGFNLNTNFQSDFYFDQNQNPFAKQNGYHLTNLRVSWQKDNISSGLWIKNLTNRQYSHLKFDLVNIYGMLQDYRGEARQIGLDVRYQF